MAHYQLRIWLTPPLALLALNLCSCALGVFGPEAQQQAQARLARAKEQFREAKEQFRDGLTQFGNSLDQITNTAAQGVGTYANGYAQGYQQYQATQPPPVTLPESHMQTGWVGGQPFHSYSTGSVNNGGQMTNGWIGNQPYHTYSTPGMTTGWIGNQPITIFGN